MGPKSYAEIVQGARGGPAPPLPVLPPSSSSSSRVVLVAAPAEQQQQQQQQKGASGTSRSYAAAVKGSTSPPPPPPTPPPPATMAFVVSTDLPAVAAASPAPAPAPAPAPSAPSGAFAHLWRNPVDHDVVIVCGKAGWMVHRHVLVGMSEWMEKYLPEESEEGGPVLWNLDPDAWNPGRLEAILRFMYYEGGDYDPAKPLETECIMHDVAHYIAGAAVLCRPMMDFALSRIEEATAEITKKLPILRHAQLDGFENGLRMALLNMYAELDQWRIRALRIVMGKLMAACFHIVLQSPNWSRKFEKVWGVLRVRVVADHKWLYQAELCEKNTVVMHGFEHMNIRWVNHRDEDWQPADDLMFPEDEVETLPKPPPQSPPSTPHRKKKVSKAIPIITPGGTIEPRPSSRPGGRGRGRGMSTGLVQPAPQPVRGQGKQKKAQDSGKGVAGAINEAKGGSSSTTKAMPTATSGATSEAGQSSAAPLADPSVPAFSDTSDASVAYWAYIYSKSGFPPPGVGSATQGEPSKRRASSPSRPSSSSSALSGAAEPFLPGGPSQPAGTSAAEPSSSTIHAEPRTSSDHPDSPARLAELYGVSEDDLKKEIRKGKQVAGPITPGSSFNSQSEDIATTGEPASQEEPTEQTTIPEFASLDINKDTDDDTRPVASPSESRSENDV
ncbi:hypothetical protein Daus18300_007150 [Diaporthe australafricana]|uniref:BTB domain-containing protein n=1 Tax=Diaporthe australafricana TaxID=127596 RepID=A0ABR3WPM7_9PEZI